MECKDTLVYIFPPGASSNSLRNLLKVSCNIFYSIIYTEESPGVLCSGRPHSRIRSHYQSLRNSQWTAALQSPFADKLWLSDYSAPRTMSLPTDIPPGIADALGYLQHHLQELTERQNASEHAINTALTALTTQLQQLTQLMTGPTPAPAVTPLLHC